MRIELGAPGAVSAAGGELLEQVVHEDGRALPLSRWYHQRSAHARRTVIARGPASTGPPAQPVGVVPALATVALPRAAPVTMAVRKPRSPPPPRCPTRWGRATPR
ncbi:MAG: hypothetical protein HS111_30980 [Kofleriaceae bacterium]|nr:hypothetical protein [Kofleriaceae bacterium]